MLFSIHISRAAHTLALAAIFTALALPAIALGGSTNGTATPDWFERYAASHPYGSSEAPDWFERHAASAMTTPLIDGRSPDTLDAAYTVQAQVVDGRSPDTLDAAQTPVELVFPGGFDWSDAGVGAGVGAGIIALLGSLAVALLTRRQRVQTT